MISAKALQYGNKNTKALLAIHPDEYPVSLQLFGSDPQIISEQAKRIEELPFQILDINMSAKIEQEKANSEEKEIIPFDKTTNKNVKDDGSIQVKNTNPKKILDLFKVLCQGKEEPIEILVKSFNKKTKNGSDMSDYTYLLEQAVFDIKGVVEQKGVQSLFQIGQATLLDNTVSGLNDFELVSFLVVES